MSALGHDQTNPMLPSGVSCADTSGQGLFENHLFSKRSPTLFQSAQVQQLAPSVTTTFAEHSRASAAFEGLRLLITSRPKKEGGFDRKKPQYLPISLNICA
jgi:hypothetical protein